MSRFAYAEISRLLQQRYYFRVLNPVSCTASALWQHASTLASVLLTARGFDSKPPKPRPRIGDELCDSLRAPSCVRGRGIRPGAGRAFGQAGNHRCQAAYLAEAKKAMG